MNESELRTKYTQAVRIIRAERRMVEHLFQSDPVTKGVKLVELDMLLTLITEFKDELKAHLSSGEAQMQLIDPPVRYE
jgi:hypothetical protein